MQPERGIATMTTAACGRNRESLLGPWPARRERAQGAKRMLGATTRKGGGAQRRKQSAQWAVA